MLAANQLFARALSSNLHSSRHPLLLGQLDIVLAVAARHAGFLNNILHRALVLVASPLVDDFLILRKLGRHDVVAKGSVVLVCFLV